MHYSLLLQTNDSGRIKDLFERIASSIKCEQGEERVQGVEILVVSANYQIIVLGFQTYIIALLNLFS
jgi:hypothetical protein